MPSSAASTGTNSTVASPPATTSSPSATTPPCRSPTSTPGCATYQTGPSAPPRKLYWCGSLSARACRRQRGGGRGDSSPLEVSDEDRAVLERWLRAHTTEQRMWLRARVVLMAADGHTNRAIAAATGLSEEAVSRWRRRYARAGLKGLADRERSGRPPVYGHDERLRVVATVTETPPDPAGHWTHQAIADRLADTGMSADTVGAILKDLDLKPH